MTRIPRDRRRGFLPERMRASETDARAPGGGLTDPACASRSSGLMRQDANAPVARRSELLDSLRGFALAGVLFANLTTFTLYFFLPEAARSQLPTLALDRWLSPFYYTFVSGKFITLFSLLFGVGFMLQMQRSGGSREGVRRYIRRLAILLLIGLLHADLLWWGDILRYYAVIGLILVPMRRAPARVLAIAGITLATFPHALVPLLGGAMPVESRDAAQAAALSAFSGHDWGAMLRGNLAFNHWWVLAHWQQACWVGGCLLVGSALGRLGALAGPEHHARFWSRMLRWVLPAGLLACVGIELESYGRFPAITAWLDAAPPALYAMFRDFATLALGLCYVAGFAALFALPGPRRWLRPLAPVGRMALSNYLAHSLVGVALFYGIGFGIGPRHGMAGVAVAFVLLFAAQVAFSRWWLLRFRFGPAEWLWRSLTYKRLQPMRIARAEAGAPVTEPGR